MPDQKRVFDEDYEISLGKYELAASILGDMIGIRSGWLSRERSMENPDQEKMDRWVREQFELDDRRESIGIGDDLAADEIIATYGPVLKEYFKGGSK